jgi:hypothetical protein
VGEEAIGGHDCLVVLVVGAAQIWRNSDLAIEIHKATIEIERTGV